MNEDPANSRVLNYKALFVGCLHFLQGLKAASVRGRTCERIVERARWRERVKEVKLGRKQSHENRILQGEEGEALQPEEGKMKLEKGQRGEREKWLRSRMRHHKGGPHGKLVREDEGPSETAES